jgi:hypothetical protein
VDYLSKVRKKKSFSHTPAHFSSLHKKESFFLGGGN